MSGQGQVGTHIFRDAAQAHAWMAANGWDVWYDEGIGAEDPDRWFNTSHPGLQVEHDGPWNVVDPERRPSTKCIGWGIVIDRVIDHREAP
jgi:hypothetical protein